MIILGLGTNLGDRLANLRQALRCLQTHANIKVQHVSPIYQSDAMLPDDAPKTWALPFFNVALSCTTALSPQALLAELKIIEQQLGRGEAMRWSPRPIDIDILKWNDESIDTQQLTIPHRGLYQRPFALWPLLDLDLAGNYPPAILKCWGSRFTGEAPFHTRQLPYRIDGAIFVGTLNITPDSFSDGGDFYTATAAIEQGKYLFASGAEVIDIGAESTRPDDSKRITAAEEWRRLEIPLTALIEFWAGKQFRPKLSVDTRNPQVAAKAIALGVDWINDVTGFTNTTMIETVADSDVKLICMHNLGLPPSQDKTIPLEVDPVAYIIDWGTKKLEMLQRHRIALSRVIFDMGIGFGNTPEQCLILLKRASEFKQLGVPLMVGHSRKSFHSIVTGVSAVERDLETAIGSIDLFTQGVDYIRVHDVVYNARAVAMQKRLASVLTS